MRRMVCRPADGCDALEFTSRGKGGRVDMVFLTGVFASTSVVAWPGLSVNGSRRHDPNGKERHLRSLSRVAPVRGGSVRIARIPGGLINSDQKGTGYGN